MRGLASFIWFGRHWWSVTRTNWISVDCLLEYMHHRMAPSAAWPPFKATWKSSTASNQMGILRSHLGKLGITMPSPDFPALIKKALVIQYPGGDVQHRPAFSLAQFKLILAHIRANAGHGGVGRACMASAAFVFAYFNMLRAGELALLHLSGTSVQGSGLLQRVVSHFKDKTHYADFRTVVLSSHLLWQQDFAVLKCALDAAKANFSDMARVRIFSDAEISAVRVAVHTVVDMNLGSIRPSGLMFHLQVESPPELVVKLGGWSPKSVTTIKSYIRIDHDATVVRLLSSRAIADRMMAMEDAIAEVGSQPTEEQHELAHPEDEIVTWL